MSQGLTWIAGRRTPLLALVALLALTVGLFAAFPPAHAAVGDNRGDVTANTGFCVQTAGEKTLDATDDVYQATETNDSKGTAIDVYHPDDTVDTDEKTVGVQGDLNTDPDPKALTCIATQAGKPIKITPNGTTRPLIEVQLPTVSLTINDSDKIVKSGTVGTTVTVKLANFDTVDVKQQGNANVITLQWVRISGLLAASNQNEASSLGENNPAGIDGVEEIKDLMSGGRHAFDAITLVIPEGTADGEYVISARVIYDGPDDDKLADDAKSASATLKIGDGGTNLQTATLSLGNSAEDEPRTSTIEQQAEDGVEPASGGDVWLKVSALNSLGNAANGNAINTLTVIAPGASLTIHKSTALGAPDETAVAITGGTNSASATTAADIGSTMFVKVTDADQKPSPVEVYALVIGTDGAPRTNTLTVSFTGAGSGLELGEAKAVKAGGKTEFTINAIDDGGNKATVSQLIFSVKDADGNAVAENKVKAEKDTVGASTDTTADDTTAVAALVTTGTTATAGAYTVEVSIPGVADSKATTTVTVSGNSAEVVLSASPTSSTEIGQLITVTATVTDADGNPVADDTRVDFSVSANTGLSAIGASHGSTDDNDGVKTKDGTASAKFAVVGSGISVVSATTEDAGVTAVVVIRSTAGLPPVVVEPDPEPVEPPEPVDGLSSTQLNNFASWSGEGSVSASELLAGLSGASGVLFYDGDSWQRWGMDAGQVIPGSRDFQLRDGDIIWISG